MTRPGLREAITRAFYCLAAAAPLAIIAAFVWWTKAPWIDPHLDMDAR